MSEEEMLKAAIAMSMSPQSWSNSAQGDVSEQDCYDIVYRLSHHKPFYSRRIFHFMFITYVYQFLFGASNYMYYILCHPLFIVFSYFFFSYMYDLWMYDYMNSVEIWLVTWLYWLGVEEMLKISKCVGFFFR
jgi:hypothetical protein